MRLAAWLRKHGAAASFPVLHEPWHLEVPRDDLERLAKKVADPLAGYPAKERHWIRAYDALVRMKDAGRDPADGSERRASLRRLMTDRRKAIWRAAQHTGWHQLNAAPAPVAARPNRHPMKETTMPKILQGPRPDITAAQIAAVLVAGVPAIATLLTAFGLGDLRAAQQDALSGALTWSAIFAGLLIGGDATLRAARNLAVAKTDAAAMAVGERLSPDDGLEDPPPTSRKRKRRRSPTRRSSTPTRAAGARGRDARRQPRLRGE